MQSTSMFKENYRKKPRYLKTKENASNKCVKYAFSKERNKQKMQRMLQINGIRNFKRIET